MLSTSHFFLLLLLSLVSILFPYTTLFRSPPRRYRWHRTRHRPRRRCRAPGAAPPRPCRPSRWWAAVRAPRSEEHTSELQSRGHLVCRLLLEKKKIVSSAYITYKSTSFVYI